MERKQLNTITFISIGLVLLVLSFFLDGAMNDFMGSIRNPVFDYILVWASWILSIVFIMLFMTSLFMWEEKKRDYIIPLWVSFLGAMVLTEVIKFFVMKDRPDAYIEDICHSQLSQYSFPSSHVAMCFSTVPLLDEAFPLLKWFWFMFAIIVAISRIYLGCHWFSDLIAGAMIGFGIGLLMLFMKKRYNLFGAQ